MPLASLPLIHLPLSPRAGYTVAQVRETVTFRLVRAQARMTADSPNPSRPVKTIKIIMLFSNRIAVTPIKWTTCLSLCDSRARLDAPFNNN